MNEKSSFQYFVDRINSTPTVNRQDIDSLFSAPTVLVS